MKRLLEFWGNDEGASAIEYALIAGLIAVAIVGTATQLGVDIGGLFTTISGKLTSVK